MFLPQRLLPLAALLLLLPAAARAQGRPGPVPGPAAASMTPAPPSDTAAVHAQLRAMAQRLFDAMKARDTVALRALLPPTMPLHAIQERNGETVVRASTVEGWMRGLVTAPPERVVEERLFRSAFRQEGGLAVLWAEYDLWYGAQFSHCGIDQFTFARTAGGWQLLSLAYTIQQGARCLTAPGR